MRPPNVPPTRFKTIGVIGAGFMGAGIAYVTALAGLNVVLIDRDQPSADRGKDAARSVEQAMNAPEIFTIIAGCRGITTVPACHF